MTTLHQPTAAQLQAETGITGIFADLVLTMAGDAGAALLRSIDRAQPQGCGPVVEYPDEGRLLWLVPRGTTQKWTSPYGVCLTASATTQLPALAHTSPPGPFWARPLRANHLTDPDLLAHHLDLVWVFTPSQQARSCERHPYPFTSDPS